MDPSEEQRPGAFKVSLEFGDVVLEFGRLSGDGAPGETVVHASERIVMPVETARRLALALGEALRPHEPALRAARAKALSPAQAAAAVRPDQAPAAAAPDDAGERGRELFQLVTGLGVPHQYERSFRASAQGLQANRFLLTLDMRDLGEDALARVLAICERLAMPAAARAAAGERFAMASCVHFGFEGDGGGVCKLYLERKVPEAEARQAAAGGAAVLLHLAFKWDLEGRSHVVSEYLWHPGLDAAAIGARIAGHVYRDGSQGSLGLARSVLALAAARTDARQLQYLEVQEPGNGRRSFDLNLYNARLQVKDIQGELYGMRDLYGLRPGEFQAVYDQIRAKVLGHLAGGVHRDGRDFFNVYYGVVGLPHFGRGFAGPR